MTKITKQELLKIAQSSAVKLYDNEVDALVKQLDSVLSYAARVKESARDTATHSDKNVNVMREDSVIKMDSERILVQAPEREENYFVVPMILEK